MFYQLMVMVAHFTAIKVGKEIFVIFFWFDKHNPSILEIKVPLSFINILGIKY